MSLKHVVLFNDPESSLGWGYTGLTTFESRHAAVGKKAVLERLNPDVAYKMEVFG